MQFQVRFLTAFGIGKQRGFHYERFSSHSTVKELLRLFSVLSMCSLLKITVCSFSIQST